MNTKRTMRNGTTGALLLILLTGGFILAGCGGGSDTQVAAPVALDTAPPAVPTGLAAATYNNRVKVAWLPNTTDGDLQGYLVYRLAFDQVLPLVDEPTSATFFVDASPLLRPCRYAVTSVDESGNESAWQVVYYSAAEDLHDPERATP